MLPRSLSLRSFTSLECPGTDRTTLRGGADSLATDLDQRSAIDFEAAMGFTVTGATCQGTQPGVPCVE